MLEKVKRIVENTDINTVIQIGRILFGVVMLSIIAMSGDLDFAFEYGEKTIEILLFGLDVKE